MACRRVAQCVLLPVVAVTAGSQADSIRIAEYARPMPEALGTSTAELLTSISHYLWPVVVVVILWRLLPAIREMIRTRDFTINAAGMSLDVQTATDAIQKQIADLQNQVALLQESPSAPVGTPSAVPGPRAPTPGTLPPPAAAGTAETPAGPVGEVTDVAAGTSPQTTPAGGGVLWVDDEPENIAFDIQTLENRGLTVRQATSTAEALKMLQSGRFFAVITDMGRKEGDSYNPNAGFELIKAARQQHPQVRLYVFTTEETAAQRGSELVAAGANGVTASSTRLLALIGAIGTSDAPTAAYTSSAEPQQIQQPQPRQPPADGGTETVPKGH